jgi:hypothetical protein
VEGEAGGGDLLAPIEAWTEWDALHLLSSSAGVSAANGVHPGGGYFPIYRYYYGGGGLVLAEAGVDDVVVLVHAALHLGRAAARGEEAESGCGEKRGGDLGGALHGSNSERTGKD